MVETASTEPRPRTLRIVQISDCHVSADPDASYRGANPRESLTSVMRSVAAWRPDLLLATGDLSEDGSPHSYDYLSRQLNAPGAPVLTLPGNHDVPPRQRQVFPQCPAQEPLLHDIPAWRLILLNSAVEGEVSGRLTDTMLEGLSAALDGSGAWKLVLLHHQPVPVDSPWIDRYALEEPERLWSVLDGRNDVRAVAWGHVHHAVRVARGAMALMAAPASSVNTLPAQRAFTPDPAGPACRWLKLSTDGALESGVLWARHGPEAGL